jgi:hypothetical protein
LILKIVISDNKYIINPSFQVACTIASACNYYFRATFLEEKKIALIPPGGYRKIHKQSILGTKYLDWLEQERGIKIEREVRIPPPAGSDLPHWRVDGYHRPTNTIIEFNGQIWHGCRCLTNRKMTLPGSEKTIEEAWQETQLRKKKLQDAGYNFEEFWECCNLRDALQKNEKMRKFFEEHEVKEPMDPRESFFGGRTNAAKLFHQCGEDEKVVFYSFTLLQVILIIILNNILRVNTSTSARCIRGCAREASIRSATQRSSPATSRLSPSPTSRTLGYHQVPGSAASWPSAPPAALSPEREADVRALPDLRQ